MIENPASANTEYQHIVRGYGDFEITRPEYVIRKEEILRGKDKGKKREVTHVSYPKERVNQLDLNYCSHRYELVPNADIFPEVEKKLNNKGINYHATYMHMNYARFYAEYTIEDHKFEVAPGDYIYPMLKVQHSYNGLTEYQITFGYFRLVCSNGLVIPVEEKSQYNIRLSGKHTQAIHASLEKLENTIEYFMTQGDKPMKNFEVLGGIAVESLNDRAIEVMKAAKVNVVENKKFNTIEYLSKRIAEDKKKMNQSDDKVNEWLLYNAINHYIHNDELNMASPKQREDKDRAVLNVLLKDAGVFA